MRALSIAKPGQGCVNEDYAIANEHLIAVSDGAGGGGIYADRWSEYLIDNLPATPICAFEELDAWIEKIWEPFYNECEGTARSSGGMVLNKFYDEGAFATLVTVWFDNDTARWMSYGDSVAFCFNPSTGRLQHSFTSLADFYNPPYLINCKDKLKIEGFRCGCFEITDGDILFCSSDALSHYIMMMHKLANCSKYSNELQIAENAGTKESEFIQNASAMKIDFYNDVLSTLMNCNSPYLFEKHLTKLYKNRLIALDDYSFSFKVV